MTLDFPRTLRELHKRFNDEKACRDYLQKIRWPDGPQCTRCNASRLWERNNRPLLKCSKCGYEISILAGTIFQDTKMPLSIWFDAIWWLTNQKSGVSALGLQRALELNRHNTAWKMLHKLRVAMVRPGQDRLSGEIEVDEVFIGGENNKQLVGVAAQMDGKGTGRIRLQKISDRSGQVLQKFVEQHVAPGSTIVTDGLKSYCGVEDAGYIHKPMKKPYFWEGKDGDADELLPRVHRVASILKRWYYGTYHGRIDPKHLDTYLNEFTFRFNRRTSKSRGMLFYRLLENAVAISPNPFT
jgi:transposase-like protein/Zn ribbon nucleic-acid-binding protein